MNEKLKLYSISNRYIEFLRCDKNLINVFDNKEGRQSHSRKYLGVVLIKNNHNYFIPFSSPKNSDYFIGETGGRFIRNNIVSIIRMTAKNDISGEIELKGTLKINNMIPVPDSELIFYDINSETDINYKIIVMKEYEYIKDNYLLIIKNANLIYNQKTKEDIIYKKDIKKPNYLNNTVNFKYAEIKCREFCELHNIKNEEGELS